MSNTGLPRACFPTCVPPEGDDGAEDDSNTCLRRNILFTSCESSLDGSFVSSPPEDHTEITIPFF